jgi:4-hydroxy-tetrahydrodipicolinate reductase
MERLDNEVRDRMIRVVMFGLGPIGAGIARVAVSRADFQIVGGIDVDPAKVGKDVGEVIGLDRSLGALVTADALATLRSARPDVVIHATGSHLSDVAPQLSQIIRAGASVVSTCEELSFPFETSSGAAGELDRLAQAHGVAVLGTGINPGFAMDTLPLALTAVSQRVESIHVLRIQDAASRRLPLQRKVGAGLTVAEFEERVRAGTVRHVGLPESVYAIAHGIGWKVDRLDDAIEPVVAEVETRSSEIVVAPGQVLGVRQVTKGIVGDSPLITLELQLYLGAPRPRDQVGVEGLPRIDVMVTEGTHGDLATAAILVNAIPSLLRAEAGLRIMEDLPLVHFHAPDADDARKDDPRARRSLAF